MKNHADPTLYIIFTNGMDIVSVNIIESRKEAAATIPTASITMRSHAQGMICQRR
jgi:hypothetical protein